MQDCELLPEDLEKLVKSYKAVVQLELGEEFPEDPKAQLWGAVGAVFNSWMNQRAKTYRHVVTQRLKHLKLWEDIGSDTIRRLAWVIKSKTTECCLCTVVAVDRSFLFRRTYHR